MMRSEIFLLVGGLAQHFYGQLLQAKGTPTQLIATSTGRQLSWLEYDIDDPTQLVRISSCIPHREGFCRNRKAPPDAAIRFGRSIYGA